jgi:hypothetical protein
MARYTEREELFAGAEPRQQQETQTHGGKYVEEMDNREVMQLAVRTHQDTTATYRRGLQVSNEARILLQSTYVIHANCAVPGCGLMLHARSKRSSRTTRTPVESFRCRLENDVCYAKSLLSLYGRHPCTACTRSFGS